MSGKKGKKSKTTTYSLQEFNARVEPSSSGSAPSAGQSVVYAKKPPSRPNFISWADDVEEDGAKNREYYPFDKEKIVLPSAPRAVRGPDYEDKDIPKEPPFIAEIGNLQFDTDEGDLHLFFKDLSICDLKLPRSSRDKIRGYGQVTFETRDDLIKALILHETKIRNRAVRITLGKPDSDGGPRSNRSYDDGGNWRSSTDNDRFGSGSRYDDRDRGGRRFNRDNKDFYERGESDDLNSQWRSNTTRPDHFKSRPSGQSFMGRDRPTGRGGGFNRYGDRDRDFSRNDRDFNRNDRDFNRSDRDFNRNDRDFYRSEKDYTRGDREYSRSDREYSRGDRDLNRGDREFGGSDRDYNRTDRDYNRTDRDYNRSDRDYNRSDRDYNRGDREYNRGDRDYNRGDRDYNRGGREYNRGERDGEFRRDYDTRDRDFRNRDRDYGKNEPEEIVFDRSLMVNDVPRYRPPVQEDNDHMEGNSNPLPSPPLGRDRDIAPSEDGSSRSSVDGDSANSKRKERKKLNLQPRTVTTTNDEPARPSSIFGDAKPVDTASRERAIEEKQKRLSVSSEDVKDSDGKGSEKGDGDDDIGWTQQSYRKKNPKPKSNYQVRRQFNE